MKDMRKGYQKSCPAYKGYEKGTIRKWVHKVKYVFLYNVFPTIVIYAGGPNTIVQSIIILMSSLNCHLCKRTKYNNTIYNHYNDYIEATQVEMGDPSCEEIMKFTSHDLLVK